MMRQKPNFQTMDRKKLRNYVLTHREDEEALRIYMERLHSEPGINRYTGGLNGQDFEQLEQLLEKKCDRL
ncbi:MAG: hypothetical protein AB4062_03780 [Crocosphaera sp.]